MGVGQGEERRDEGSGGEERRERISQKLKKIRIVSTQNIVM